MLFVLLVYLQEILDIENVIDGCVDNGLANHVDKHAVNHLVFIEWYVTAEAIGPCQDFKHRQAEFQWVSDKLRCVI